MRARSSFVLLLLLAACTDFREPSDLRFARILAVRAEPPELPAEGTARIDVLATGDDGVPRVLSPDEVTVTVADGDDAGAPLPVTLGRDATGHAITAPAADELARIRAARALAADAPVPVLLVVRATIGSAVKVAEKTIWVGGTASNPLVTALSLDGQPLDPPATMAMAKKAEHKVAVAAEGRGPLSFAWYSDVGDVDGYYRPEATVTTDRAGPGVLLVVVRDARGGVTWTSRTIHVVD